MVKESEYYFKVIEAEFNKPFTMAKKFHKDSKNSADYVGFVKKYPQNLQGK